MKAVGLLSIFLPVTLASAIALPIAPTQFVIDSNEPYVYLKFDHVGVRKPATAAQDEGSEGLWLRIVNNCNLPIKVGTFDWGTRDSGVGVPYAVVPVPGARRPWPDPLKKMPRGYETDVATSSRIAPGGNLLFSIPLNRVGPHWYVQVRFDFVLPGPKEGYHPYSLVDFTWEDLPEQYHLPAIR